MTSVAVQQVEIEVSIQDTYTFAEAVRRLEVAEHTFMKYVQQGKVRRLSNAASSYSQGDVEHMVQVREARQAGAQQAVPSGFCTADEGRRLLGIALQTFYQYTSDGKITVQQLPDLRKCYRRADIDRMIAKRAAHQARLHAWVSDEYYTPSQARAVLGIAEPTLTQWGRQGKLQRVYLPHRLHAVFRKAEVDALAAAAQALRAERVHGHPDRWVYQRLYESVFAYASDETAGKSSRLGRYLCMLSGWPPEDVQDIVQGVFLKLWEDGAAFFAEFPELPDQRRVFFYKCRQAVMLEKRARSVRRKMLYEAGVEEILVHHRYPSIEHEVVARERWQVVLRHLQQYPVKRQVIAQMLAQGFTTDEIVAYLRKHDLGLSKPMVTLYRTQMADAMQRALAKWDEAHGVE